MKKHITKFLVVFAAAIVIAIAALGSGLFNRNTKTSPGTAGGDAEPGSVESGTVSIPDQGPGRDSGPEMPSNSESQEASMSEPDAENTAESVRTPDPEEAESMREVFKDTYDLPEE